MSFRSRVLAAKHRYQVHQATKGFRAHQAKLARIRAREEEEEEEYKAFKLRFPTAEAFLHYMRDKRGCGP
jgi:hypothetical protein